jgi:DNA polymerase-1
MPRAPKTQAGTEGGAEKSATSANPAPTETTRASVLPPPGSEEHLYLVDLSGYVFRAYHAIAPLSSSKGEPTHAVMGTVNMLQKVVNERRPHLFAVAMDSRGPTFRHALDERYKANRPAPPPDLSQQMRRCEEIVRAYNIPIYRTDGMEADDLIASVAHRAMEAGLRIIIVSSDKDLMQLVHDADDRVLLWDSMRDKVFGAKEIKEKWGVSPSRLRDLLALVGDSSDNVPGVPGVGPKTAADLLATHGSLEGVFANLPAITKAKLKESLVTHEADARLSYALVGLKADLPVPWEPDRLRYGQPDVAELRRLFTELEFTRLLEQFRPTEPTKRELGMLLTREDLERFAAKARETRLLVLGLEATSQEAMRAAAFGLSLSSAPGEGFYLPLSHRYLGAPKQLGWDAVRQVLGPLLVDASIKKVGHDLKQDELLLGRQGMALDGPLFDTMLASYLLDSETGTALKEVFQRELGEPLVTYGEVASKARGAAVEFDEIEVERATQFAAAKVLACAALAQRFEPRIVSEGLESLLFDVELPLSRVLAEMERTGVLVDTARLEVIGKRAEGELAALEAKAKELAGRDFAVRSRDQLENILFDDLKLPVLKKTPKGGRSTDASVLEELAEQHELPKVICEYREIDKLKGTYVDALPRAILPATGRIHTTYDQAVAATGRLSSRDPNLQNIPIRTALGREIRSAFVAPPGHVILAADYSQVELRLLAHLSQDPELLRAFRDGEDVHVHTASLIFDVPKGEVTKVLRSRAKTVNFGVIYGMGEAALAKQTGVSRAEAAKFIEAYFTRYAGVRKFMDETVQRARSGDAVRTLLGRRRFLPNLHSANRGLRTEAERVAKNTPIQGTAADLMKLAMVKLGARPAPPGVKMVMTVHDELVFEVPSDRVEETGALVRGVMANAMKLDVPLVVDVGYGPNWAEAH